MTLDAIVKVMKATSRNPSPRHRRQLARAADVLAADRLVTTGQAATLLGVRSRNTVKNWLERGFARTRKTPGGQVRLYLSDVLAARGEMEAAAKRRRRNRISIPASKAASSDDFN